MVEKDLVPGHRRWKCCNAICIETLDHYFSSGSSFPTKPQALNEIHAASVVSRILLDRGTGVDTFSLLASNGLIRKYAKKVSSGTVEFFHKVAAFHQPFLRSHLFPEGRLFPNPAQLSPHPLLSVARALFPRPLESSKVYPIPGKKPKSRCLTATFVNHCVSPLGESKGFVSVAAINHSVDTRLRLSSCFLRPSVFPKRENTSNYLKLS